MMVDVSLGNAAGVLILSAWDIVDQGRLRRPARPSPSLGADMVAELRLRPRLAMDTVVRWVLHHRETGEGLLNAIEIEMTLETDDGAIAAIARGKCPGTTRRTGLPLLRTAC